MRHAAEHLNSLKMFSAVNSLLHAHPDMFGCVSPLKDAWMYTYIFFACDLRVQNLKCVKILYVSLLPIEEKM